MNQTLQTDLAKEAFTTIRNLMEARSIFGRVPPTERTEAVSSLAEAMHNFDPNNEVTMPMVKAGIADCMTRFPFMAEHSPLLKAYADGRVS